MKRFRISKSHYNSSYSRAYYLANRQDYVRRGKDGLQIRRDQAFSAYGGPACACCGESQSEFLTLDHIAGDGAAQDRQLGSRKSGDHLYRWLRKEGYPPGFRVLCFNCNCALGIYGHCPHGNVRIEKDQEADAPDQLKLWKDVPRNGAQEAAL